MSISRSNQKQSTWFSPPTNFDFGFHEKKVPKLASAAAAFCYLAKFVILYQLNCYCFISPFVIWRNLSFCYQLNCYCFISPFVIWRNLSFCYQLNCYRFISTNKIYIHAFELASMKRDERWMNVSFAGFCRGNFFLDKVINDSSCLKDFRWENLIIRELW